MKITTRSLHHKNENYNKALKKWKLQQGLKKKRKLEQELKNENYNETAPPLKWKLQQGRSSTQSIKFSSCHLSSTPNHPGSGVFVCFWSKSTNDVYKKYMDCLVSEGYYTFVVTTEAFIHKSPCCTNISFFMVIMIKARASFSLNHLIGVWHF